MLSETRNGRYGMLQKIKVECKTCGVSDSFYSNLSVEQFKLKHAGHEVVGGAAPGAPLSPQEKKAAPKEPTLQPKTGTLVSKVVVSLEPSTTPGQPVIGIRGFGEDGKAAFGALMPFDEVDRAKEILAKGEFDDYVTGRHYVWREDVVEQEPDAKEALSLPSTEPADAATVAPEPVAESAVPAAAPAAAAETVEPPAPAPARASSKAMQLVVPQAEEDDDEGLLVSKSWYIQGAQGDREEAVRVSKVLRAFRWRVEPVYTIGVMLDDMLSIETSRNQISRALIERVEAAGYRLSAVTIELGRPVAWFRRREAVQGDDSASQSVDESQLDLEPTLAE
jgi:hypothetical protein